MYRSLLSGVTFHSPDYSDLGGQISWMDGAMLRDFFRVVQSLNDLRDFPSVSRLK